LNGEKCEMCEFKNGILLNLESTPGRLERNVRSMNTFPAYYLSMFWKRNRKSMKAIILRERDDCE
jgi:lipopolysaccharide biosynthesis protein